MLQNSPLRFFDYKIGPQNSVQFISEAVWSLRGTVDGKGRRKGQEGVGREGGRRDARG
jgi:hypothetical protein